MAFDLRCPDCASKLRLDERPAANAVVECPECGIEFPARDGMPKGDPKPKKPKKVKKEKAPKPGGDPKKPNAPMEAQERTFANPFLLLAGLLVGFGAYIGVATATLNMLGRAGKVVDMTNYVPVECNVIRGANLSILNRYPGYADELKKYAPDTVRAGLYAMAEALGYEKEVFLDYVMIGQVAEKNSTVYVFRCAEEVNPEALAAGLKATQKSFSQVVTQADVNGLGGVPGGNCLVMPASAPGFLANAYVYLPTERYVIVAQSGPGQGRMLAAAAAAGTTPEKSLKGILGDAHMLVLRGHGWLMIRPMGGLADYGKALAASVKKDVPPVSKAAETTKMLGAWNSFGATVRFGGVVDCADEDAALDVVKGIKAGPFGKGDEAEVPREVKTLFPMSHAKKEMSEWLLNLDFRTSGTAAYFVTKLSGENAKTALQQAGLDKYGKPWPIPKPQ